MKTEQQYVGTRLEQVTHRELHREPNKWLVQMPQYETADRILDIACGLGYDSIAWARAGKRPIGIDFNADLVKNARRMAREAGLQIDFAVSDATKLPFGNDSFDMCFSENLFEHVPNWQDIVTEAHRVLRPGGVLFVRTSNRQSPINHEINHLHFYPLLPAMIKNVILRWVQKHRPAWINYTSFPAVNWFTHRGLAAFLQRNGFETFEVFDLFRSASISARRRRFRFLASLLKRHKFLRYIVYPFLSSVQLVAVKTKSEPQWFTTINPVPGQLYDNV
jgi:ubiquinone/menaquinone biosynthesis C-methylase UbiE